MKKIILIFIDGLGIGRLDTPNNPINKEKFSILYNIIKKAAIIDPVMGVEGLPQSATGQTSLLCGVNAQKILSGHSEGFPGPKLQNIIKKENIFKKLKNIKRKSTFANGYWLNDISEIDKRLRKMVSVTTIASLNGLGYVRPINALINENAVYQDITQKVLKEKGANLPIITLKNAAQRLINISKKFDFTLFEYFQTDIAGHKQDLCKANNVLSDLDDFISNIHNLIDFSRSTLIITSDHGNIEDLSTPLHTNNLVPFYVKGFKKDFLTEKVKDLSDVTPAIVEWFSLPD